MLHRHLIWIVGALAVTLGLWAQQDAPPASAGPVEVDLSISKSDDPDPVIAGEKLTYTITVLNGSADDATNVTVTDTLPLEVTYVADTAGCTFSAGTGSGGEDQLTCDLGTIDGFASTTFEVMVLVPSGAVRTDDDGTIVITNTAVVSADEADPDETDNTVTESTFVQEQADLRILKTTKPQKARVGEQIRYTIVVDNLGPSTARNVVIRDTLITSYKDFDANGCSLAVRTEGGAPDEFICNFAASTGVFDLGTFGSNWLNPRSPAEFGDPEELEQGRIIITIEGTAEQAVELNNIVTVESETPDPDMSNNITQTQASFNKVADLSVKKLCKPADTVRVGELLTCTIFVENLGPSPAQGVMIRDDILSCSDADACAFELVDTVLDPDRENDSGPTMQTAPAGGQTLEFTLGDPLEPKGPDNAGRWVVQVVLRADTAQDINDCVRVFMDPDVLSDNSLGNTAVDPDSSNNQFCQTTSVVKADDDGAGEDEDGVAGYDVSGDGAVDARDAALMLQHSAGLLGSPASTGDQDYTSTDAALVLQYAAGLLEALPAR